MAKFTFKKNGAVKHINREDVHEQLVADGWELEKKEPKPKAKTKKVVTDEE